MNFMQILVLNLRLAYILILNLKFKPNIYTKFIAYAKILIKNVDLCVCNEFYVNIRLKFKT